MINVIKFAPDNYTPLRRFYSCLNVIQEGLCFYCLKIFVADCRLVSFEETETRFGKHQILGSIEPSLIDLMQLGRLRCLDVEDSSRIDFCCTY